MKGEGVLRITFGPKRNEMIGDWRKFHNERAMIFLKSYSKLAPNPAINIVRLEKRRRKMHKKLFKAGLKRINK
jgi:hypothetical protein